MNKMFKQGLALTFVAAMLCTLVVANAAMPEPDVMPLYNFIESTKYDISISGSTAYMEASITADADKCQITMTLQMLNGSSWDDVTSWTGSKSASEYEVERSYSIDSGESLTKKENISPLLRVGIYFMKKDES